MGRRLPAARHHCCTITKWTDEGLITWANLIIATGHNNSAMNPGELLQVARAFVNGKQAPGGHAEPRGSR